MTMMTLFIQHCLTDACFNNGPTIQNVLLVVLNTMMYDTVLYSMCTHSSLCLENWCVFNVFDCRLDDVATCLFHDVSTAQHSTTVICTNMNKIPLVF